jgi:signal transduction histidine kinase
MYAEMLSAGMVPDAGQRQQYLETLRIEADRLAHLVENVLQYARLERGRPGKRREEVTLQGLLDRCQSRLADRAAQAEMKLVTEVPEAAGETALATDSAAVEQILFNLVDNACKYAAAAADKRIHLAIAQQPRHVTIGVRDHGPGIAIAGRKRLFQPFSKSVHEAANSAPGVGLGLALSRRLAADLGGRLELQSPASGGCAFVLTLPR